MGHLSALEHRDERAVADDNVVESMDAKELRPLEEPARQRDIISGWLRIAARMVVGEDDRGGTGRNGSSEHLARIHGAGVHCAFSHAHIS